MKKFNKRSSSRGASKPAFAGKSSGQFRSAEITTQHSDNYRGRSSRRNFGRGRGASAKKKGGRIDESRFINKAAENNYVVDYAPKHKFSNFKIDERLKKNIAAKGFTKPTAIQDKAIPEILNGRDIIGLADTGTGKTAAFVLPFIDKILKNKDERVIIMAPTRELAQQINSEFMQFAKGLGIFSVAAVGGAGIRDQIFQIKKGYNILIGTPGRIKDLVNRRFVNLNGFSNAVLDEADRMLDMGFIADMKFILDQIPKKRQTLCFSATLSKEIENLSQQFLNDPIKIETKLRDTSSNVDQNVIKVGPNDDKIELLHELLIKKNFKKVLIFGKTKMGVEKLSRILSGRGFKVASIHGDKTQSNRQKALKMFRDEKIQILVATDVAARGLDIPEVSHVINYDLPSTYEDYIHRIGRTGRAHNKGTALTFIGGKESLSENDDFTPKKKMFIDRSSRQRESRFNGRRTAGNKESKFSAPKKFGPSAKFSSSGKFSR